MSGSARCCWKCRQNTWDGLECVRCEAPEVPDSVCVFCGDSEEVKEVPELPACLRRMPGELPEELRGWGA